MFICSSKYAVILHLDDNCRGAVHDVEFLQVIWADDHRGRVAVLGDHDAPVFSLQAVAAEGRAHFEPGPSTPPALAGTVLVGRPP